MFGIRFMKAAPTTYVLHYRNGAVRREGPALSFYYFAPTSTIVAVPLGSAGVPFVFNETTADFQAIAIQGQLVYRVAEPKRLALMLDLSLAPMGAYASDDYQKLPERLVHATQVLARAETQKLSLREALVSSEAIGAAVLANLKGSEEAAKLGIEILGLSIQAIHATPEMTRALEAAAREELQRQSDEAVYARRNAAVEQERLIKENELNTEIAVEEKQRQIKEKQMAAEIALEQQRAALTDQRVENERKDADSRAYALEATMKPIRDVDWHVLMMLGAKGGNPNASIAMAFQELAANASKIGQLNVTPDLLRSLIVTAGK